MKIKEYIVDNVVVQKVIALSKRFYVSRRHKVSWYDYLKILFSELKQNNLVSESQSVAFSFMLAIFPGIIFLFTLIPFFPIEDFDQKVLNYLEFTIPPEYYKVSASTIKSIVDEMILRQRGGLLSFGFLFALFAATNGMLGLMTSFNNIYQSKESRSFIKTRLVAFSLTFLFVFVLFFSFFIIIVSRWLVGFLETYLIIPDVVFTGIDFLEHFIVVLIFFKTISIIYYVAPIVHRRISFFSLGSIVATVLFLVSTNLFSYYISNFSSYNKLYGSLGTLIGLMLWLQITSFVVLLGFEINAALDHAIAQKNIEKSAG